jgi:hypothetical protein
MLAAVPRSRRVPERPGAGRGAPGFIPGAPSVARCSRRSERDQAEGWSEEFGWRQVGSRMDPLDGRRAETVFYERGHRRIAYTIVSGE